MSAGITGITKSPVRKAITGADPAAGADINEAVPAGKWWKLLSVKFTLATSAVAANRRPALVLEDGAAVEFWRWRTGVDQAASLTRTYQFLTSLSTEVDRSTTFNELYEPLDEDLVLPPGGRVKTVTQAKDAGDNYGAPVLYVVEYG